MAAASALPRRGGPISNPYTNPRQPAGTFLPGTKVQVGSHRVTVEKYLSEGGFAHVYVVRVPRDNNKHELAVLKRVAVPDKEHLANMRTEVETMKKLRGHQKVVTYMDSHASQLKGGGYEVFLLMEYCAGGGLIDFMNTRLQHRLTEPEILKVFGDVAEGVATMHYLKPPLLHRDLKVENVLISRSPGSDSPTYKLCDLGSAAPPRLAATTAAEGRMIEEDVQKHTTMQYRSPEMVDVWRKQPIDEKSDIWALGVLLYKLCYYTTPFENAGQMAILNATFDYPSYPVFSTRLKKLIGCMLREDPKQRPNIYQVIAETCSMRGIAIPIKDIYSSRTASETRQNEAPPSSVSLRPVEIPTVAQNIPDITPMRRGRPSQPVQATKTTPSSVQSDPFAALDAKGTVTNASERFPSLETFSITNQKKPFSFAPSPVEKPEQPSVRPGVQYKSTGVGPSPPASRQSTLNLSIPTRPVWEVPDHHRSTSQPRASLQPGPEKGINETRNRSAHPLSRPSSGHFDSNLDFLKDQELNRARSMRNRSRPASQGPDSHISNTVDYLRSNEGGETSRKSSNGEKTGMHRKRSSLGGSLSGAKTIFAGKFGKRLDRDSADDNNTRRSEEIPRLLEAVTGSAESRTHSDVESAIDSTEELPAEVKRELERRQLIQEEKRVNEAAAAYKARVAAEGGGAPTTKASTIQQRVQSLLDEGRRSPVPQRTAEGYGPYTDSQPLSVPKRSMQAKPAQLQMNRTAAKPTLPPKAAALRTGQWQTPLQKSNSAPAAKPQQSSRLAALLAKDSEGVPDYPPAAQQDLAGDDDLEEEFYKRYPSLEGLDVDGSRRALRVKDV
ncbi:kinase-like protein [Piedraia hortae CBS 480.64]|uniref:non-specific serine/threonine protein kinase n=1 Tax=Piedraia hortae CBS 480.64 TaxID=1314780 RepID=A0A6A7BYA2_9PEZI|nr:kinase-like protein [Piedraia hortae CBS 480.64]